MWYHNLDGDFIMEKKTMSILLIEDDEIECQKFKSYTETLEGVKVVATTNSSDKGIELFKRYMPEAIVLDIELHKGQGSGLEFLQNIKECITSFRPIIVVTTNASSSLLYNELHDEGVDLIFYKHQTGYSPKIVVSALLTLRKTLYKFGTSQNADESIHIESEAERTDRVSDMINSELDLIGISPHLKGRDYIHDAILYLIESKSSGDSETVFNYLANLYKKTASSIGRVMQTSINRAWMTSSPEDLELHYTAKVNFQTGVPTPTEFIYYYAKKIQKNI